MKKFDEEYSITLQLSNIQINTVLDARTDNFAVSNRSSVHSHPFYEVLISINGISFSLFQEKTVFLPAGSICIIPPGLYHRTEETSSNESKRSLRFIYKKTDTSNYTQPLYDKFHNLLAQCNIPIIIKTDSAPLLYNLLFECSKELDTDKLYAAENVQFILAQFYIHLLRLLSDKKEKIQYIDNSLPENSRRVKIELWLKQNFKTQITLTDLAEHMNLSERQTDRILKDIYHLGFREIVIDLRMHYAVDLLSNTKIPVSNIAYMTGYDSLSGFYYIFKKYWKISPLQYRKNIKNK